METRTSLRYLLALAAVSLALLAVAGLLNFAANPYWMWPSSPFGSVAPNKPFASIHPGLAKGHLVERATPATLLLGNSRVEVGLDPESPRISPELRPAFNLTQPGYGVSSMTLFLRQASARRVPRRVIVGLDFTDFLPADRVFSDGPSEFSLRMRYLADGSPNDAWRKQQARDMMLTLWSLRATLDSVSTLLQRSAPDTATVTALGFNPLREYVTLVRQEGHFTLFQQKNLGYAARVVEGMAGFERSPDRKFDLAAFRTLIEALQAQRAEVDFFLHPLHADFLELFAQADLWPRIEQWKRTVVATVEESARSPDAPSMRIWDFMSHHAIAIEPVPAPGDRATTMQWYWESGHYKKELGEILLARMLDAPRSGDWPVIGRILTSSTIESALTAARAEREAYQSAQPDRILYVRRLVEAARARRASRSK